MGNIGFSESLIYSAVGLIIVFATLSTLAIAIILSTKLFKALGLTEEKQQQVAAAAKKVAKPVEKSLDEDEFAVIIAAVQEELGPLANSYQVKSITEVK